MRALAREVGDNGTMPEPEPTPSRRAVRAQMPAAEVEVARHARTPLAERLRRGLVITCAAILLVGAAGAVTAAVAGPPIADDAQLGATASPPLPSAVPATALPIPAQDAVAATPCDDPAVATALATGTDEGVVAAFGGAARFRAAVATGGAPCISLSAADRLWVVVNKQRPLDPLEYEPASVQRPEGMQRTADVRLRPDAAAALTALIQAASAEGAGTIGLNSGYRSYASQQSTHRGYVNQLGEAAADRTSARAGYSEHHTGIAADVVACAGGCGGIEAFAGTPQADWVAENAWRFGFVIRYENGQTGVTGYEWEPWHLRFIGVDLAAAYHDGGFHALEDFFGLPAAPDYAD